MYVLSMKRKQRREFRTVIDGGGPCNLPDQGGLQLSRLTVGNDRPGNRNGESGSSRLVGTGRLIHDAAEPMMVLTIAARVRRVCFGDRRPRGRRLAPPFTWRASCRTLALPYHSKGRGSRFGVGALIAPLLGSWRRRALAVMTNQRLDFTIVAFDCWLPDTTFIAALPWPNSAGSLNPLTLEVSAFLLSVFSGR
jgi:hypothetical protein